jgi:hypothetical protein
MVAIPFDFEVRCSATSKLYRAGYRRIKREELKTAKHQKREHSQKKSINRKQIREIKKKSNLVRDLLEIIHSYFPSLIRQLKNVPDPRYQSYVKYGIDIILLERILAGIFSFDSQRAITQGLNDDNAIKNISAYLGEQNLTELPHGDTINDCLKKMNPDDLESLIQKMVYQLIRRNTFSGSRRECPINCVIGIIS